jgi:hypothetical protein
VPLLAFALPLARNKEKDMTTKERLQTALERPDGARLLRAAVLELGAEGCPKGEIAASLEKLLLDLRGRPNHREADEDAVLDVLDGLAGWCHADARLLPEQVADQ